MKTLVQMIGKALVDNPEAVEVAALDGRSTTVVELRVAKDDIGKIIGRRGRTATAIRTIVEAVSCKEKKRTVLDIIE